MQSGVAIADRSTCGRIRVSGDDRLSFLHGQSTADINALKPGQGCDTVRCQGWVIAWAGRLWHSGPSTWLIASIPGPPLPSSPPCPIQKPAPCHLTCVPTPPPALPAGVCDRPGAVPGPGHLPGAGVWRDDAGVTRHEAADDGATGQVPLPGGQGEGWGWGWGLVGLGCCVPLLGMLGFFQVHRHVVVRVRACARSALWLSTSPPAAVPAAVPAVSLLPAAPTTSFLFLLTLAPPATRL